MADSTVRKLPRLSLSILKDHFPIVRTLRQYLEDVLKASANDLDAHEGLPFSFSDLDVSPELDTLLDESYVAGYPVTKLLQAHPQPMTDMREIIDRSQEMLLKSKAPLHIITNGYQLGAEKGEQWKKPVSRNGVINRYVNTIVTALQAPEWDMLLQRIGSDAMIHLLTETSIFMSLPNDCLCQMTGQHLFDLVGSKRVADSTKESTKARTGIKRPLSDDSPSGRRSKRLKVDALSAFGQRPRDVKTVIRSPVEVSVIRPRLFYSRPLYIPNTKHIIVGLHPNHILNRLHPSYQPLKSGWIPESESPKQLDGARRIAKYIFPRQYGLASPFHFQVSKYEPYKIPDFVDRDLEIQKLGPCKTPKRLKETLPVLDKLIWRHGKCKYKLLRDASCPSKIAGPSPSDTLDSSIILELMSEHLSQVRSQNSSSIGRVSLDSAGNSILPSGMSQAREHTRNKPRFAEFCCSHDEVYRYVVLVTKAVIPKRFWGSAANFRTICQYLRDFIGCRRYETLSLHHILQRFSTSDCEWLMPRGNGQAQARVSVTDSLKRRELLEDFIFWFFDSFIVSLLRTTFYVTESAAFRNHALYFRLDDWEVLCAPLVERLTSGTFEKMSQADANEILRQRRLGFSFVRLLPKETGVRPIVNQRRKQPSKSGQFSRVERSINQILQVAFQILSYEKERRPHLLGASIFSADDVYGRLKAFKLRLLAQSSDGTLPKLYFVKMDVQACFDTIEQTKLLEILRELISEDGYLNQRFGQVSSAAGRTRRSHIKKAIPDDDHPHFLKYATELAGSLRHIIFVDQLVHPGSKRREVLELLEQHISDNIVKIGTDYYRQVVGIPQGSSISTLLCSFFYGDLERRNENFSHDLQSLLMRLTDDYLFITTSLTKARGFLQMMNQGHPEYGCFISRDKTLTNFDYDEQIMNVTMPNQQAFPWCGYMIHMKSLSVSVDYTRYGGFPLVNTLTIDRGRRSGVSFLNKMLQLAKTRSHVIYADSALNSEYVVHLNIYQNFLLSAMKMHAYLCDWATKGRKNSRFIENTVRQMLVYCYATLRSKAMNKIAKENDAIVNIQKLDVIWLGTHAFHAVLSRRPQQYKSLIKSLGFDLARPKYRLRQRRFRKLVKEGLDTLAHIQ